jgi:predicted metal-dependent hydrolase
MQNNEFSITITRCKRKNITIFVNSKLQVNVKAPKKILDTEIHNFITQKRSWILNKLDLFAKNTKTGFYLLGKKVEMKVFPILFGKSYIEEFEDEIRIFTQTPEKHQQLLEKWLKNKANKVFEEALNACFLIFSKLHSHQKPTLILRKMSSRWGSMSHFGKMTLNIKLLHTPLECINYVVMHELCHLKHQNHGKNFYIMQEELIPNYKELKAILKTFSNLL